MARLARWSLAHPTAALGLVIAATLVMAAGLPRLRSDVGYRAFLGPSHPAVEELDRFLASFGGGLPMLAVWSCVETPRCDRVFDAAALEMARDVTAALERSDVVRSVTSPANAPIIVPSFLGPVPLGLLEEGRPIDDDGALAERALRDPSWVGQLVSADGRVGAIVVELVDSRSDTAVAAWEALRAALAPFEARGFRFHQVGGPVEFVVAGRELERATARLVPVMVAIVGVILVALFRSPLAVACELVCVGVAVAWTMGMLGWLGWAQNSLTQTLPPLVLVIGVCDGIHLLARYASEGAELAGGASARSERARILERVAAEVGPPCLMTTLTTAAGFLSFATADLQSFQRFGAIAAFGVTAALVLSFTLLPVLLVATAPERLRSRRVSARWGRGLAGLTRFAERRATPILALAGAGLIAGAWGMTQLRIDASFEELYGESSRVVRWARFVGEHLRRPDTLEIELVLPPDAALEDPGTLAVVSRTASALSAIETLGPARSVVVPLAQLRAAERIGEEERPETRHGNARLLAVLEQARDGEALARWVDPERRRVRISVESEKSPQDVLRRVMQRVERVLAQDLPPGWSGRATGPLALVHDMIDAIRSTQLRSFAGAALAVGVLLAIFLRSLRLAALALVPTVLPVVGTLGSMGILGIPLDVGSAMVAAVVLGIAVDDAVHLLDALRRRSIREPRADAMRGAVSQVGRALVTTSLALALGFAALALSPWQSVASFGLVSSIAIVAALASALVVLPALVLRTAPGARLS